MTVLERTIKVIYLLGKTMLVEMKQKKRQTQNNANMYQISIVVTYIIIFVFR